MTENDGAVTEVFVLTDGLDDGIDTVVFPVERNLIRYKSKDTLTSYFVKILRYFAVKKLGFEQSTAFCKAA